MLNVYEYHTKPDTLAGYEQISTINQIVQQLIVSKLEQYDCEWGARMIYEETEYRIYRNGYKIGYVSFDPGDIGTIYIIVSKYVDRRDKLFQNLKFIVLKDDVETITSSVSETLDQFLPELLGAT